MEALADAHKSLDLIHSRSGGVMDNTALHWSAAAGDEDAMRWLIKKGADVNAKNGLDDTPLHSAAWRGWEESVAILLEHGADTKAENKDGKTPREI